MKKESATNFQRVGDGVIPIKDCRIPIPSEPEVPKALPYGNIHPVGASRVCCVSAQKLFDFEEVADAFVRNLSGTASVILYKHPSQSKILGFEAGAVFCPEAIIL